MAERVAVLENKLKAKSGGGWGETARHWAQIVAMPVALAVLGYWLIGSVDLAIKERQADISGLSQIREALKDLYAAEPIKESVDTASLSMAAFGGIAAAPLIEAVNLGGDARPAAAERGLIAAAMVEKVRVCGVLASVRDSISSKLYTADTREVARRLAEDLQC